MGFFFLPVVDVHSPPLPPRYASDLARCLMISRWQWVPPTAVHVVRLPLVHHHRTALRRW
jgi:hypothetical protein